MVVPKQSATTITTQELGKDLVVMSDHFAAATTTDAAVGGTGGALGDFNSEGSAKIWPVVIGESIAVLIMLVAMLRAVVLPALAVVFDLLTAAATFGILTVLYSGPDALLGGPGYIDPISIIGIFAFVFGVSMVYEVALLYRTRETFLETGDACGALRTGLTQTAAAATGAAAVMVAAIIPFATVDLLSVQVFGVGVAIAIVLDALIVRPVLLPAAAAAVGRWSWWPLSRQAPPTPQRVARLQDAEVLVGRPAEALAAASAGLDLLVCGSRGHGPVRTLVEHGVSHALVRRADCPVLVVAQHDSAIPDEERPARRTVGLTRRAQCSS
jgi:RND superfamily putative drug exporter